MIDFYIDNNQGAKVIQTCTTEILYCCVPEIMKAGGPGGRRSPGGSRGKAPCGGSGGQRPPDAEETL